MAGFYYFQHDANASNDVKLIKLESKLGIVAYAYYFKTLELMTELGGYLFPDDQAVLSQKLRMTETDCIAYLELCEAIGLFAVSDQGYYSPRFVEWLQKKSQILEKRSKAGAAGAAKRWEQEADRPVPKAKPKPTIKDSLTVQPKQSETVRQIVEFWNSRAIKNKCRKVTSDVTKAVEKRLREYTVDEIQQTIGNYLAVLQDEGSRFSYAWNLIDFLNRGNGFPVFFGDPSDVLARYGAKPPQPDQPAEWNHPFAKPDGWDAWSGEERRKYILRSVK